MTHFLSRALPTQATIAARDEHIRSLEQSLQDATAHSAELEAAQEAADQERSLAAARHQEEVFKLQVGWKAMCSGNSCALCHVAMPGACTIVCCPSALHSWRLLTALTAHFYALTTIRVYVPAAVSFTTTTTTSE